MQQALRILGRDLVSALTVLALVLFFYGGPPTALPTAGTAVAAAGVDLVPSFCGGGGPGDNHSVHGPCHACRSNAAVLPPPPCVAEAAFGTVTRLVFGVDHKALTSSRPAQTFRPRAPPVLI